MDTYELIPRLPENAIDDIGMFPVVGIEMKRPFDKAHKSVLSVAVAQGPDELKLFVFFPVRGQHEVLVVGHAQPFSPLSGKIGSTVGPKHEVKADR